MKLSPEGYNHIRPLFGGHLSQSQVNGIERMLKEIAAQGIADERHAAYILATQFHETGKTMQPVQEGERGKGRRYGQKIKRNGTPYAKPDKIYYGRGDVQITWYDNYQYIGKLLGLDLLNNPELCLDPAISAKIAVFGMIKGVFTGVKLSTYFNKDRDDSVNARKIINGNDCDMLISTYHHAFLKALEVSN